MAYYGERLAEGFEMINGQNENNRKPDCLRAPTATEVLSALRDNEFEPHDDPSALAAHDPPLG